MKSIKNQIDWPGDELPDLPDFPIHGLVAVSIMILVGIILVLVVRKGVLSSITAQIPKEYGHQDLFEHGVLSDNKQVYPYFLFQILWKSLHSMQEDTDTLLPTSDSFALHQTSNMWFDLVSEKEGEKNLVLPVTKAERYDNTEI